MYETPGHTAGHISYVFAAEKLVFVGDTLFSIGCGRVIEGNAGNDVAVAAQAARPAGRHRIYCGHEYTHAKFALPGPSSRTTGRWPRAQKRSRSCSRPARRPSRRRSAQEKAENPFLRADLPEVASRWVSPAGRPGKCSRKSASARIVHDPNNVPMPITLILPPRCIRLLDLEPHPEGGHFRQTFRDSRRRVASGRPRGFDRDLFSARARRALALASGRRSRSLALSRRRAACARNRRRTTGPRERIMLGPDLAAGERPQGIVPAHAWQAARNLGEWTLGRLHRAPGFEFARFELAPPGLGAEITRRELARSGALDVAAGRDLVASRHYSLGQSLPEICRS